MANEKIEKAAGEYATKTANEYEVCNSEFVQELAVAFERGAQYSLSHQWIPVEEQLPEEGEHVLFAHSDIIEKARFSKVGKPHFILEWHRQNDFDIYYLGDGITHWMPLPPLNLSR